MQSAVSEMGGLFDWYGENIINPNSLFCELCTPPSDGASDNACASVTVHVAVGLQTVQTATGVMASWQCPLPPVVPVVVNPATQTSEPIAAQMAPFQMIKKSSYARANYCSSALVALFADLVCADIAAATAAVTPPQRKTLKATTIPDHSQAYVHASQLGEAVSCQRHQRGARRTYGFPGC